VNLLQVTARHAADLVGRQSPLIRRLRPAYESLLDWSGRGIAWNINGETFRIDPRQRQRLGHNYDPPVAQFIRERIKPGALCFDVGANVGVYVLQFARWSRERGHVIAFEPNPSAVTVLKRHIELNDLKERVTVVPAAVSASPGKATLYAGEAEGMSRLGEPNRLIADQATRIEVPVITLDDFCEAEQMNPDWLLIDIEGFEIAALEGARRLIERRGRALNIVVEMHPGVWDSAATTRTSAEKLLADLELRPVALTGQLDPLAEHGMVWLERFAQ
jgi:FkbM family methyltransferase